MKQNAYYWNLAEGSNSVSEQPWSLSRIFAEERRSETADNVLAWAKLIAVIIADIALVIGIVWGICRTVRLNAELNGSRSAEIGGAE